VRLLLCHRDGQPAAPWLADLRAALPGAQVDDWRPGLPPVYEHAVAWNPPQQLFDEQPQLRAVFNLGAGVDRLLALCLPPALRVVRLEDAGMAVQMAEYVCHALIRFFRGFDGYARQQQARQWAPRPAPVRGDFPVGVMGLGALGARVAQAVRQFDFPVLGWSRTPRRVEGVRCFDGAAGLHEFLRGTRVLVCLLPLTGDTRGILRRDTLARLRPGGYVINVARGGHLVEADLLALLDEGHLAGAALDVASAEPLPADSPLWRHPGVTVTPHVSAQTGRREAVEEVARAVRALAAGAAPSGLVERGRGY
jgi:glyoxylate/hydroxypyruvate reductase A